MAARVSRPSVFGLGRAPTFFERRVDLLAAVADALDDLADRIRADAVLPRNVINFIRLTSGHSGAIRFSALTLTVGHLLLLCLNSLQQLEERQHSIIRQCLAYISIRRRGPRAREALAGS